MRVILTGGSGFLGKQITMLFENLHIEVIQLWRTTRNYPSEIIWDFKAPLPSLPKADALIHLAAAVDFTSNSLPVYTNNILPAVRLADWCNKRQIPAYIASTASIHGKSTTWSIESAIVPQTPYAQAKLIMEDIFSKLHPHTDVFRIGGIYGINGPAHLGLNVAISSAFYNNAPPVLYGAGQALRNYISVTDAARWLVAEVQKTNANGSVFYMAGPQILTIQEWLQLTVDILLPCKKLSFLPGESSQDIVVAASSPPVNLTTFEDYLHRLLE